MEEGSSLLSQPPLASSSEATPVALSKGLSMPLLPDQLFLLPASMAIVGHTFDKRIGRNATRTAEVLATQSGQSVNVRLRAFRIRVGTGSIEPFSFRLDL